MALNPHDGSQRRQQALTEFAARGVHLRRRDRLDAIAAEAIDALRGSGVDPLLLKGAALAQALYEPDLERGYFDIDLIVDPADRTAAGHVLAALGYTNASAERGLADVGEVLHAEGWSRLDPDIGNAMIDLHWKLEGCLAPPATVWRTLRGGAETATVAGSRVLRLGRPALALHTALHLAQHGAADPKATADLSLGLTRWDHEVWRGATSLAAELDATDAFASGLRLVPEGALMADRLGVFPTQRAAWDLAHRSQRPRGAHYLEALGEARTLRARGGVLRRALLPSRAWIRWEMRWASRSPAHLAAAYLLHLLRAPLWAARTRRFDRARRREI